jgi:hypothetical protein
MQMSWYIYIYIYIYINKKLNDWLLSFYFSRAREVLGSATAVNQQIMTGKFGLIGSFSDIKHGEGMYPYKRCIIVSSSTSSVIHGQLHHDPLCFKDPFHPSDLILHIY